MNFDFLYVVLIGLVSFIVPSVVCLVFYYRMRSYWIDLWENERVHSAVLAKELDGIEGRKRDVSQKVETEKC